MSRVLGRSLIAAAAAALIVAAPASADITARGSVGQAYVTGADRGERIVLRTAAGRTLRTGHADRLGGKIFRHLARGTYRASVGGRTRTLRVLGRDDTPPASLYRQRLKPGLNYVRMRDGVELAMTLRLPPGKTLADGPFPTLIEHSGYQTAAPNDLLSSLAASVQGRAVRPDPLAPASSTVVGSAIGPLLGFAVVSVQMRGSGCSGGAFDLFDLPTTYDGYDMVETVGRQSWVKGAKVGLVGISFSGITQLFAAGTRPPHLAAITPMSVTDDLYAATGYPGGIRNSGFALSWVRDRMDDAQPAPQGGQPWARVLTRRGDRHCIANQRLRLQTENAPRIIDTEPFRDARLHDQRSATSWMRRIDVPTFFVGQFQDEQTGGHFTESLGLLARNPKVWITLQNGVHTDSLAPAVITRWVEFLKLYVADEVPTVPEPVLQLSGELYKFLAEAPAAPVVQSRFAGTTDVAAARAQFERDPRVRLLMDNGATAIGPGTIGNAWELGFGAYPIREAQPTAYYPGAGGALTFERPAPTATATYTGDPGARPATTLPGTGEGDAWKAQPPYRWAPVATGKGLGWTTAPLERDLVIAGSSSLDLRLRSSARDTDLQVTLSEVRPDGAETYVQSGWLRASHRLLDPASSLTRAIPTHRERDARPLRSGAFTTVRVPIVAVAHAFRAGSRLRVTVQAPGGDRPRWRFATIERGRTRNTVALGGANPTRLVLPVLQGVTANGTPLPGPTALRGQPSRRYVPAANGG